MKCKSWEVWFASVRFEDAPQVAKKRPVLILEDQTAYAVCLKMTGTPRPGEYTLKDWAVAGLKKETTVRIGKVLHMQDSDLEWKVGSLTPLDIANIQALLR